MDKPFKTYNQQMKYLREVKKIECNGSSDKQTLIKSGYFNLINGYKTPFIKGVDESGHHIYIGKTTIEHFKAVENFDEEIRYVLLKNITHCEEEIRTMFGHKFDYVNDKGKLNWFDINAYNPNIKAQDKIKVIAKCYNEIDKSHQEYIHHYLNEHNHIPTWIFVKAINFSTFISFAEICKPSVINSVCELYGINGNDGKVSPELLISILHWMRKIRNSCAHNERIYGIHRENGRVNQPFIEFLNHPKPYIKHRSQRIIDVVIYLRYFLNDQEYMILLEELKQSFLKLKEKLNPNAFEKVRSETGIRNLDILDNLKETHKNVNYNSFENMR